jgi:DNA-binding MarR family transcriptional regulator
MNAGAKTEDDFPLEPTLKFMQKLWQLNHALEKLSSRTEATLGVTAQQRMIIRCVGKYPGMTAGQLATLLHLDPGTISAAVRRLEQKRLVERRRDDRDRRRVTLGLTARGRSLDRPAAGTVEHAVETLLRTTDAGALVTTREVLDALARLLVAESA